MSPKRRARAHTGYAWERIPGSYKSEMFMGEWRRRCAKCGWLASKEYVYAEGGAAIVCGRNGCDQHFYEMHEAAPKYKPAPEDVRDEEIRKRLTAARAGLTRALDDAQRVMARVVEWRKRIKRLETALKTSADTRIARAKQAVATRKNALGRRGINLKDTA